MLSCFQVVPFILFEYQSKWIAGVLSGRIPMESTEEMRSDIEAFYSSLEAAGVHKRYTHKMGDSQVILYKMFCFLSDFQIKTRITSYSHFSRDSLRCHVSFSESPLLFRCLWSYFVRFDIYN